MELRFDKKVVSEGKSVRLRDEFVSETAIVV